ncbi:hypothetical protein F4U96_09160 [Sphingobium limneticum]|uniref:Terminase small subunit n=1 Tax=Sphingobium limneticum TaxID=1007511 RepID=A0A5J5I5S3_9SPHN|nr:hypothetical protein F4U96_09160 [Sphingobium limneticum]KAA9030905.1 hypothetical protein F4U95_09110 [Sphingobium limneticum]
MAKEPKPNGAIALSVNAKAAGKDMQVKAKRKRKQPYRRTEKLTEEIWARLAAGYSLIEICEDEKMPARVTLNKWMAADPDFEKFIDDAYKWKARYFGEAIENVASGGSLSTGDIRRDELKVKALMWLAGKYNRKVFGDAVQHEVTDTRPVINLPAQFAGFGLPVIDVPHSPVDQSEQVQLPNTPALPV